MSKFLFYKCIKDLPSVDGLLLKKDDIYHTSLINDEIILPINSMSNVGISKSIFKDKFKDFFVETECLKIPTQFIRLSREIETKLIKVDKEIDRLGKVKKELLELREHIKHHKV